MKITALAGGVGGAKLAHGLAQVLPAGDLTVVVNTGDDFEHFGLYVCPDLDTVCYTLAGLANPATGWGRDDESWRAFESARSLGGPDWFQLGDLDLGTHLERTRRLRGGAPLSQITADFCAAWGVQARVLPMTDAPVHTIVLTSEGELTFQDYFVRLRCEPRVRGFRFQGIEAARPAPGVLQAIREAEAVVICPSNPWVSIDPILALPDVQAAVGAKPAAAVSPIIGGETVKGPAAKMFRELGIEPSALAVAQHYGSLLRGFVLDQRDEALIDSFEQLLLKTRVVDTLMKSLTDRARLAQDVLNFVGSLLR